MNENMKYELQSWYKQKAVIEFLTHKGIKPIEIFPRFEVVYGDETMDVIKVWAWARKATAGSINLFDEPHSGCLKMQRSAEVEQ